MFKSAKNSSGKLIEADEGTVIGAGCSLKGNINEKGNMSINGYIEGDLEIEGLLVVEEQGKILGNIISVDAVIKGNVKGDLKIKENLRIDKTANISGNIEYLRISVEEGAIFNGNCKNIEEKEVKKLDIQGA